MPARYGVGSVLYEMPVNSLLLGTSPPGFSHSFPGHPSSFLPHRLPARTTINMGIGRKGDLLQQLQRSHTSLPLRSCIKTQRLPSGTAVSSRTDSTNSGPAEFSKNTRNCVRTPGSMEKGSETIARSATNGSPCCARRKKRVSFADSKGLSLQTVKYMDGPSNMPPNLHIHLLQDVTEGAKANPTHPYTYVPAFEQPASNYLEFRDRLEKECVCLENVLIKDNITIVGTIKVKNVAFEKSVMVRVTFDEWASCKEVQAEYVIPSQACSSHDKFDTFSFELNMPPNLGGRSVEFCINYTANSRSFWDNNRGNNYKVVTDKEKKYVQNKTEQSYERLNGNFSWGQFSYWQVGQEEMPYW